MEICHIKGSVAQSQRGGYVEQVAVVLVGGGDELLREKPMEGGAGADRDHRQVDLEARGQRQLEDKAVLVVRGSFFALDDHVAATQAGGDEGSHDWERERADLEHSRGAVAQ